MQSSKDLAYTDSKKASTFKKKKKINSIIFPKQTPYLKHYAQDEISSYQQKNFQSDSPLTPLSLPNKVDITALKAL